MTAAAPSTVDRLTSRKFIVFTVVTFLTVYGAVTGAISVKEAIGYIGAAGAVYTAAEGVVDAMRARAEG